MLLNGPIFNAKYMYMPVFQIFIWKKNQLNPLIHH